MLLSSLVLFAHARDLDLSFRAPDGSTTGVVLRDVGPGALPGLELSCCDGGVWTARLRLEGEADTARLAVDLASWDHSPVHLDLALPDGAPATGEFPGVGSGWALDARFLDLGAPSPAEDAAASALMGEVSTAYKAGDIAAAVVTLRDLVARYPGTKAGVAAGKMLNELELIGTPAPPLDVARWLQGSAPRDPRAPLLLVFTEEWCPHCKTSLPSLVARAEDFRARGITVVLVTRLTKSSTEAKMLDWMRAERAKFAVALDRESATSNAYRVTGIPAMALVKDGVVVWRGHPERLGAELLERLL